MASSTSNRATYPRRLNALRRSVIKDIRALVDQHLRTSKFYGETLVGFFPTPRKLKQPCGADNIIAFTEQGVLDDYMRHKLYIRLDIETLIKLLPLARKFDEYHRKASK